MVGIFNVTKMKREDKGIKKWLEEYKRTVTMK